MFGEFYHFCETLARNTLIFDVIFFIDALIFLVKNLKRFEPVETDGIINFYKDIIFFELLPFLCEKLQISTACHSLYGRTCVIFYVE